MLFAVEKKDEQWDDTEMEALATAYKNVCFDKEALTPYRTLDAFWQSLLEVGPKGRKGIDEGVDQNARREKGKGIH